MENYIVPATKYTPRIELHFNDKYLRIEGDSWPENAMEFYQPLFFKLDEYFSFEGQSLNIDLFMDFINTSSSKMIDDMVKKLQTFFQKGHEIKLQWFYPEGDMDCKDKFETLLEDAQFPYAVTELKE